MHPALAFQIKRRANQLNSNFGWDGCESVQLEQTTNGLLGGSSTTMFAADPDFDMGINDETASDIAALIDVLCELSREFEVDWQIEHDYEEDVVGCIREGIADVEVIEELETICAIGEMLGDFEGDGEDFDDESIDNGTWDDGTQVSLLLDTDEPRLLKFPGVE